MAIPSEYAYIEKVNDAYVKSYNWNTKAIPFMLVNSNATLNFEPSQTSMYVANGGMLHESSNNELGTTAFAEGIIRIDYNTSTNVASYTWNGWKTQLTSDSSKTGNFFPGITIGWNPSIGDVFLASNIGYNNYSFRTSFTGLSDFVLYVYQYLANVDLYVDNECWVRASTPSYTWSNVDEISGNSITQELTTLNDINDGEINTTSDETDINFENTSNLYSIISKKINNW